MFDFNSKHLHTKEKLSSGQTGSVYPYYEDGQSDKWVVKHIQAKSFDQINKLMHGLLLNSNHDHPYIVPVKGYSIQEDAKDSWNIYIKMPRMKGNLRDILEESRKSKKGLVPKEQVVQYLYCLSSALEYLERKGISHGNIKPTNILVDKSGRAYLTDIRMTKPEDGIENKDSNSSSAEKEYSIYLAPELQIQKNNSRKKDEDMFKADQWSLGMVILELCVNKLQAVPFNGSEKEKRDIIDSLLLEVEESYGDELSYVLSGLLNIDPAQRKTCTETRKIIRQKFPNIMENVQKEIEKKLISSLDPDQNDGKNKRGEDKKNGHSDRNGTKPRLREDMFDMNEENGFRSWVHPKSWLMTILLGVILAFILSYMPGFKDRELEMSIYRERRDGNQSIWSEPNPASQQTENEDSDYGIDIFVELDDSVPDNSEEIIPQFNNTVDALKAKWGEQFDFFEENQTLYVIPVNVSRIFDETVNSVLMDLIEANRKYNSEGLEKLDFDLSWCKEITDNTITYLSRYFAQDFKGLTSLRLIFWKCEQISDNGIAQLGEAIGQNLKNLEVLKLDFEGCGQLTDTGITTMGFHIKQNPERLHTLSLNFRACVRITDAGIGHLGYYISFFTNLQELRLPISSCPKITDEGVKQMSTYIGQYLTKLKLLVFNVGKCGLITDRGLGYFSQNIFNNLKNLQEIWMNFEYSAITDEGVKQLSLSISQHGSAIQKLDIRFAGCSRLKDEGFKHLGFEISQNLKDLKFLRLYIGKDKQISGEIKKQVREALTHIPDFECVGC